MTYNQAIKYCTKRISRKTIKDSVDRARLATTKVKIKKGLVGTKAIFSMFDYFGIRDKSKYKVNGQEMTKAKALKWCFDQVSATTLTYKDQL